MKAADWKAKTYNVGNAYVLAECANLVYEDNKDNVSARLKEKFGMKWVQFFRIDETEALVTYNDAAIILAFRGTSSLQDALTDIRIKLIEAFKGNGRIHEGFRSGSERVWNEVWNSIGRKRRNRTIWITGHSLGGALALTAAARLQFEKYQIVHGLYTFGQPRAGDPAFTEACHKTFGNRYFRFVHNNDIVPRVPFRLMGFEHTGIFKYINADKKPDDTKTWEEITRDRLSGRIAHFLKPGTDGINDHSMSNYLGALSL
jgi:triacylglycerol lipase